MVNFFATAQILLENNNQNKISQTATMDAASKTTGVGGGCGGGGGVNGGINNNNNNYHYSNVRSAFGSMAAADLVVMTVYCAVLQTATRSKWLPAA